MRRLRLGVGYRAHTAPFVEAAPALIDFLEVTAEHWFDEPAPLVALRERYPLLVHGLGLSIGSVDALDETYLTQLARVCDAADPPFVSEHLAFTRSGGIDLGHLNPFVLDAAALDRVSARVAQVQERLGRRLLLENITTHLPLPSPISEPEFFNRLCERTGCGVLLDLTNLYVNSRNRGASPHAWLDALDTRHVGQVHIIGYSRHDGRYEDFHAEAVQSPLLALLSDYLAVHAPVPVLVEWDRYVERGADRLIDTLIAVDRTIAGGAARVHDAARATAD